MSLLKGSIIFIKIPTLIPRQFFTNKFLLSEPIFCFKNNLLLQMSFWQSLSSLIEDHQNPSITPSFPLSLRGMKGGYQTSWNDRQAGITSGLTLNKKEVNRYSSQSLKWLCLLLCIAIYKICYCDYTYVKLNI
jgi:hypothetical protein